MNMDEKEGRRELRQRCEHIRRVTRKESPPRMRAYKPLEKFQNTYHHFESSYSRGQLQRLEKCFLMYVF